jgi:hypothetical protein
MLPSTKVICQNFELFVNNSIAKYELHFYDHSRNTPENTWFKAYWKPFFDELIKESGCLYHTYKDKVAHPQEFARELQEIAEQGLINFERMTVRFTNQP